MTVAGVVSPWFVLGVPEDAPLPIVRAAWRRAIREFHPDAHGNGDVDQYRVAEAAWHELREIFATRDDRISDATIDSRADNWLTNRPSPTDPLSDQRGQTAAPGPDWWASASVSPDNSSNGSGLSIDALTPGSAAPPRPGGPNAQRPQISPSRVRAAAAVVAGTIVLVLVESFLVVPLVLTAFAIAHRRRIGTTVPAAAAVGTGCAGLGGLVATVGTAAVEAAPRMFGTTAVLGATATAGVAGVAAAAAVSAWRFDTRSRER